MIDINIDIASSYVGNEASFFIPFPKNMEPHAVVIYRDLLDTKDSSA